MITNLPVNGDAAANGDLAAGGDPVAGGIAVGDQPLLIDHYLPRFDVALLAHEFADANVLATWRALRDLDLLRVRSPLISALLAAPAAPGRAARLARRRPHSADRRPLAFDEGLPGWLWLGETPLREVCVGAVGVFWDGTIRWEDISAGEFADFDEPGYGKVAVSLSLQGHAQGRSLVNYECRITITDGLSRERFRRHWAIVRRSAGQLMRATVATVAREAERLRQTKPAKPAGA